MPNRMDEDYFDEKKELACQGLSNAVKSIQSSVGLIKAWRYAMPELTNPEKLHDSLRHAELTVRNARRDFEKVRWASARTELEFEDWLRTGPGADLC